MEIQTNTESIEVRMAYSLLHVPLTHGLVAYKLGRGPLPDQPSLPQLQSKLGLDVIEGITTEAQIKKFLQGKTATPKDADAQLVHPDLLEGMRTKGFTDSSQGLSPEFQSVSNTPFTDITAKGADPKNIVRMDYSGHMVFNLDGESLPVAVHCDYISAGIRNGKYDLEKAEAILKADPRIRFVEPSPRYGRRSDKSPESYIQDVPYYNNESGCAKFIEFWFMPTADDAKKLWEKQKSYGTSYPSTEEHRAMFDLDILGLRAGGAAKYNDFHKSDEYVSDTNDD